MCGLWMIPMWCHLVGLVWPGACAATFCTTYHRYIIYVFIETGCWLMHFSYKSNSVNKPSIFFYQEFMKPKSTSCLNTNLLSSLSINLFQYLNIATFLPVAQDHQPIFPSRYIHPRMFIYPEAEGRGVYEHSRVYIYHVPHIPIAYLFCNILYYISYSPYIYMCIVSL